MRSTPTTKQTPHEIFESGLTRPIAHRERALRRLKTQIQKWEPQIIEALRKDLRKCEWESRATETGFTIAEINHTLEHLQEWTQARECMVPIASQPASARVLPTPRGAVLIIAPWNYPFQLALAPLISAIAAGNTAVIKPSELTPSVSSVIKQLIDETFPDGSVQCVEGGPDITGNLLKQPFAHFFFTGSTRVGKIVARAAAEQLAGCTLELGGKSPCIVDATANIKHTARRIAWGKALNAGQTCVAPDYVLAHADIHDQLVQAIKAEWTKFFGQDPRQSPDYGRVVNANHFDRLVSMLDQGAGTIHGGRHDRSDLYIEPTVITGVTSSHPAMREEIFGPILPVIKWQAPEEIDPWLKAHPDPLAFYVFTKRDAFAEDLVTRHEFGGGCVNHIAHHLGVPDLPFGGIRSSGVGQYHGKYGFDTFTHYKGILDASAGLDLSLKYPPYKSRAKWLKWLYR